MKYEIESGFVKPEKKNLCRCCSGQQKTKRIITYAVVGAVVLLVIAIGVYFLMNRDIEVVDLTDWTENNAQLWARENGVILQIEEEYSDEVEAGKVISQSVPAGSKIKKAILLSLPSR